MLGDGVEEVMSPLTSIWNDDHVSKYTNALGKELMKCLWCDLDLGRAHSTRMVNHLLKNRCAGISSCQYNIPHQHVKQYQELINRSIESKNRKRKGREDELQSVESHQSEAVAKVLGSKKNLVMLFEDSSQNQNLGNIEIFFCHQTNHQLMLL